MIHKLKALCVAAVAVLALSAVAASSASAEGSYTASLYPTTGTATSALGNTVFTTEAGSVECFTHYDGTLTESSSQLTVKVNITGCKAFGFASATVNTGSCDHLFTTPIKTGNPNEWTVKTHVKCTNASQPITVTAGACELTIGEQSPSGHIIITNTASDVDFQANVTGIAYTVTKDGFLCPFNGTGAKTGATYRHEEPVTLKATNGASIHIG